MANRILLLKAPTSIEALNESLQDHFFTFSPRLKEVAQLAMHEPLRIATESVTALSAHIGVPQSTFTRLAKVLGFGTFMAMQALFKEQYINRPRDYLDRVRSSRDVSRGIEQADGEIESLSLHEDFARVTIESLRMTALELSAPRLEKAVLLMLNSKEVWVHGVRRAFPVAAYLNYLLLKLKIRASLLDDVGGFFAPSLNRLHSEGVLIMVTYSPHAPESEQLIAHAVKHGVKIIAITDPTPNPHANHMAVRFEIREGEVMGFRSLSASMYLAQILAVTLARKLAK